MTDTPYYEIEVGERLAGSWSDWFDGLQVTNLESRGAVLVGPLVDQAALHGVLERIRDLNLTLISVRQVNPCFEQYGTK